MLPHSRVSLCNRDGFSAQMFTFKGLMRAFFFLVYIYINVKLSPKFGTFVPIKCYIQLCAIHDHMGVFRYLPPLPGAGGCGGLLALSCFRRYPLAIRGPGGFLIVARAGRQSANALPCSDSFASLSPPLLNKVWLPSWSPGYSGPPWPACAPLKARAHPPPGLKKNPLVKCVAYPWFRFLGFALALSGKGQGCRAGARGASRAPPRRRSSRSLVSSSLRPPCRRGFRFRRFALGAPLSRLLRRPSILRQCARLLTLSRYPRGCATHPLSLCHLRFLFGYRFV